MMKLNNGVIDSYPRRRGQRRHHPSLSTLLMVTILLQLLWWKDCMISTVSCATIGPVYSGLMTMWAEGNPGPVTASSCEYASSAATSLGSSWLVPYVKPLYYCAVNSNLYLSGKGCGRCFRISYNGTGGTDPGRAGSTDIQVVDSGSAKEFDCHLTAFSAITNATTGVFPIQYQQIECSPAATPIVVILDGDNAYYVKILIAGGVTGVSSASITIGNNTFNASGNNGATYIFSITGTTNVKVYFTINFLDGTTQIIDNNCFNGKWPVPVGSQCSAVSNNPKPTPVSPTSPKPPTPSPLTPTSPKPPIPTPVSPTSPKLPTPTPPAPTSPTPTPATCFSGHNTVEVKGVGTVLMNQLKIGDYVKTAYNQYTQVYGFGHYHTENDEEYLQIHFRDGGATTGSSGSTSTRKSSVLEISSRHLVFVMNKNGKIDPIRASDVVIGDSLISDDDKDGVAVVKAIHLIRRNGIYAPLTQSGDLLVSGIHVSNHIDILDTTNHMMIWNPHVVGHALFLPQRLFCRCYIDACAKIATYNNDGYGMIAYMIVSMGRIINRYDGWLVQVMVSLVTSFTVIMMYFIEAMFSMWFLLGSCFCCIVICTRILCNKITRNEQS